MGKCEMSVYSEKISKKLDAESRKISRAYLVLKMTSFGKDHGDACLVGSVD